MKQIHLGENELSLHDVRIVARERCPVRLPEPATRRIERCRRLVESLLESGAPVYGVTTGFGRFSEVSISPADRRALQVNLLRSHAVGLGPELPPDAVRAAMLLRADSLSQGYSGVRAVVVRLLVDMLNSGVVPAVPSQGSLGASGDLAPLAHMALVLIGEGEAWVGEDRLPGAEALGRAGLQPLTLEAKEGLALINGTQVMTALGALVWLDIQVLLESAELVSSLSLEALRAVREAFSPRVHKVRPHPGQVASARRIRQYTGVSTFLTGQGEIRLQDAYALRCIPQVHGAVRQVLGHVREVLECEIRSVTDNPLVFPAEGEVLSGGNFHGAPLAVALDYLAIGAAQLGNMSERRTERLVNPALNEGLPAFLTRGGGLNSGLMIAQYAAASLVSENKVLCHPASVDSIPSSANQEDYVSMGTTAARKARVVADNVARVLAIEAVAAAQAFDLRREREPRLNAGKTTEQVFNWVREIVPFVECDRSLREAVEEVARRLLRGELLSVLDIEYE